MRKTLLLLGAATLFAALLAAGLTATGGLAFAAGEDEKPATVQETAPDNGTTHTWRFRAAFPHFFSRQVSAVHSALSGTDQDGFVVGNIDTDSPLGEAGVVRGDIILAIGDTTIKSPADLRNAFDKAEPGDKLTLRIQHGDAEKTVTVTVPDDGADVLLGAHPCGGGGNMRMFAAPLMDGAGIVGLVEDSPAVKAGLKEGDRIVAIDGEAIATAPELVAAVAALEPGAKVKLDVETGDGDEVAKRTVDVTLGANPDDAERAFLGVQLGHFGGFHHAFPGIGGAMPVLPFPAEGDVSGTFVAELTPDGPASAAGVKTGDVIVSIDGAEVAKPEDVKAAIDAHKPGDVVTVTVRATGQDDTRDVKVTLAGRPDDAEAAFMGVGLAFAMRTIKGIPLEPGAAMEGLEEFNIPFGDSGASLDSVRPGRIFRFQAPRTQPMAPAGSGTA